jgi:asparagine synthase (glutamine-hydrolysing)
VCGIAGAFRQRDGDALARTMIERLAHRGPDAFGVQEIGSGSSRLHLAHRRLSIIDLSTAADQPLAKDGLHLSFNGEIYNFHQLRAELENAGTRFLTNSDTEVLLEAWRAWGPSALGRLRGMFAFALFDERTGSLVLARDPLGIKPLYVMPRGEGVLFASELKALVAAVGPELAVDARALVASTLFYFLPEEQTSLRGVYKLPPGSWSRWGTPGSTEPQRYWDPTETAMAAAGGPPEPDLASVVEASVTAHLVADVPVASFLSGGLDSSLVTAIAARHQPSIEAYTITFRQQDQRLEAMPDDAVYARKMAAHLGIRLHEIEISPDIVDLLPRMVDVLDEPIGDPAAINTMLMCQAARESGVKVLLSGMGADELFGGYRKHLACLLGARYRSLPRTIRSGIVAPSVGALPVAFGGRGLRYTRWAKRFLTFAELPEEAAFRRSYTLYDSEELGGLLGPGLAGHVDAVVEGHRAVYAGGHFGDPVNRMCLTDCRVFLPGLNLSYTDRASMAASTEVRVPFVDPHVFRAAFSFPGDRKIRGRTQKIPLRQAAQDWLPAEVIDRPKASFGAPLRAWVTNDLGPLINDVLIGGRLVDAGFLRAEPLRRMVAEQRSGRRDLSKQLWQLLSMELWYRNALGAGAGAL